MFCGINVNWDIFTGVAKSFADIGKSCPNSEFLTSQMSFNAIAKIKFARKNKFRFYSLVASPAGHLLESFAGVH